jgi:hypothetical protein
MVLSSSLCLFPLLTWWGRTRSCFFLVGMYDCNSLSLSLSLSSFTEESSLEFHHQRVYLSTRTHSVTKQYCLLHEIAVQKLNVDRRARKKRLFDQLNSVCLGHNTKHNCHQQHKQYSDIKFYIQCRTRRATGMLFRITHSLLHRTVSNSE